MTYRLPNQSADDDVLMPVVAMFSDLGSPVIATGTAANGLDVDVTRVSGTVNVNIVSGAAAGPTYTEGEVDATISGPAIMWEDAGDTLRSVSAATPLPVAVISGGGGGTQYADAALRGTATGTLAMGDDGVNIQSIKVDTSGVLAVQDNGGSITVDGVFWQGTQPVSGTFWQATQPVSGTFWQATQPVSGTFWQATQPISAASLPLPTGAATSAAQTDGTQKAITRGGAKGATTAADMTSTAEGADHQALDVQIYHGGVAKDPTAIRTLTTGDAVTATLAAASDATKLEDAAAVSGDRGQFVLVTRNDLFADQTSADGDYASPTVDVKGRVHVREINNLIATTISGANAGVTLTIGAAGAGLFHYITSIEIVNVNPTAAAIAGSAVTLSYTTTNIPGSPAWTDGNALAAGASKPVTRMTYTGGIKTTTANTATTVVAPAIGAGGLCRITVTYYIAP